MKVNTDIYHFTYNIGYVVMGDAQCYYSGLILGSCGFWKPSHCGLQPAGPDAGPKPGQMGEGWRQEEHPAVKSMLHYNDDADQKEDHQSKGVPKGDAQHDRRGAVESGLRLPYEERIRLKKLAQRRKMRQENVKPPVKIRSFEYSWP